MLSLLILIACDLSDEEPASSKNTCLLEDDAVAVSWSYWEPPADCPVEVGFDVIESEADFEAVFACSSGLDWSESRLIGVDGPDANPGVSISSVVETETAVVLTVDDPLYCNGANPMNATFEALLLIPASGLPVERQTCQSVTACDWGDELPP